MRKGAPYANRWSCYSGPELPAYVGEPTHPPAVAWARDPPARETDAGRSMNHPGDPGGSDPLARAEPDYVFDRRITWWCPELRR